MTNHTTSLKADGQFVYVVMWLDNYGMPIPGSTRECAFLDRDIADDYCMRLNMDDTNKSMFCVVTFPLIRANSTNVKDWF